MLNLENNLIDGALPQGIWRLQRLEYLYLTHNRVRGPLPDGLGYLGQIRELRLDDNRIDGTLPATLGDALSRPLTPSHAFSRPLTPSHPLSRLPTPSHALSRLLTPSHAGALHALDGFGPLLEEYTSLLLPAILRLLSQADPGSKAQEDALFAVQRISAHLPLARASTAYVPVLLRILREQSEHRDIDMRPQIVALLTTLMAMCGRAWRVHARATRMAFDEAGLQPPSTDTSLHDGASSAACSAATALDRATRREPNTSSATGVSLLDQVRDLPASPHISPHTSPHISPISPHISRLPWPSPPLAEFFSSLAARSASRRVSSPHPPSSQRRPRVPLCLPPR